MWIGLNPSIDLSLTGLELAWQLYITTHHSEPWQLVVTTEDNERALELVYAAKLAEKIELVTLALPADSWFFCGPHGLVGSEGA